MKRFAEIIASLLVLFAAASCDLAVFGPEHSPTVKDYDRVLILYSAGYNSISSYLKGDIDEIIQLSNAPLPLKGGRKALVVVTHSTTRAFDYSTPTSPYVINIFRDFDGKVVCDTVLTMEAGTILTTKKGAETALGFIQEHFPSQHYGMIFSSHGTGWLPRGYYGKTGTDEELIWTSAGAHTAKEDTIDAPEGAVPYIEPYQDDMPVKSLGNEVVQTTSGTWAYEFEIYDFPNCVPMHLDYLLMDACLMGGIEVAYEFRHITDYIGFSAAEIPAEGFYYPGMVSHLLQPSPADPQAVCEEFYNSVQNRSGSAKTAVISYIDCSKLEALGKVCLDLFEKYRDEIASINPTRVQKFYRHNQHYFYDLRDILKNAGISYEDSKRFEAALNDCVLYEAHTPRVMNSVEIKTHCGFSMFLPCHGNNELREFYKKLAWNEATALVK